MNEKPTTAYNTRTFRVDLLRRLKSLAALKGVTMENMLNDVVELGLDLMLKKSEPGLNQTQGYMKAIKGRGREA